MAGTSASEPVRSLFVTLRRGLAGKPEKLRNIVQALGLKYPHQCLEKPNNDMIRGMLAKVPHLVIVETDRMFYLRSVKEQLQKAPRPPLVVHHPEAASHPTLAPITIPELPTLPAPSPSSPPPRPRSVPPPVTPALLAQHLQQRQQHQSVARPLQSPMVAHHLAEHMAALPEGLDGKGPRFVPSARKPLRVVLQQLTAKRAEAIGRKGLYSQEVAELNQRIATARAEQVQEEESHRRAVLEARHTPGPHQAKVHAAGKGSRRGMLAEAREQAAARLAQRQQRLEAEQRQQQLEGGS